MTPTLVLLLYCGLVTAVSLWGGWLPSQIKLTHLRMQFILSFVSGVMLGVAVLHMLPHAIEYSPSLNWVPASMLAGLLVMFFLLRMFHVHHRDHTASPLAGFDPALEPHTADEPQALSHPQHHDHGHDHGHDHHHDHRHDGRVEHPPHASDRHRLSWVGLCIGLVVHSVGDGVALAASVAAEVGHGTPLLALGTFLAVLLHKPLDALSITSLMRAGGWSSRSQTWTNGLFSLTCPLGALGFWYGTAPFINGQHSTILGCALAFSAGFFLCIALSDLLPEVAFHSHDRLKLSAALLLGVALAVGTEAMHFSQHGSHPPAADSASDPEHRHDH